MNSWLPHEQLTPALWHSETHGIVSEQNEERIYDRKFRKAFASNTISSPAYPRGAGPYRQNEYDITWGRSKQEKAVSLAFPKGVVPRVAMGSVEAQRQVRT